MTIKAGTRTIYIKDVEIWRKTKLIAESQGTSISHIIMDALRDYVEEHTPDKQIALDHLTKTLMEVKQISRKDAAKIAHAILGE